MPVPIRPLIPVIGGVLEPVPWDRPECRNKPLRSEENKLLGCLACCISERKSFNISLLKFEPRPVDDPSFPDRVRSTEINRLNDTRPLLKELRNPLPEPLALLPTPVPEGIAELSIDPTDVWRSMDGACVVWIAAALDVATGSSGIAGVFSATVAVVCVETIVGAVDTEVDTSGPEFTSTAICTSPDCAEVGSTTRSMSAC